MPLSETLNTVAGENPLILQKRNPSMATVLVNPKPFLNNIMGKPVMVQLKWRMGYHDNQLLMTHPQNSNFFGPHAR